MREIRFRAWWKDAKLMADVTAWRDGEITFLVTLQPNSLGQEYETQSLDEGQYELMQFTGLKDKNGKEIYEGDVLENDDYVGKVVWDKENARFILESRTDGSGGIIEGVAVHSPLSGEIVGNIYENPEKLRADYDELSGLIRELSKPV